MDDPFDPWQDPRKLGPVESRARAIWASPLMSWAIICGTIACSIWFWFWPPLPGIAVTLLGGAAAIMTFREMQNTHKLLATFAIFMLMGIELRDIRLDREKADAAQESARAASEANFKTIGNGISSAISQSHDQFSSTVSHVDHVSTLAEESLKTITGGDSWGWVGIRRYDGPGGSEDIVGLDIENAGKHYPLRGIRVVAIDKRHQIIQEASVPDVPANAGFLAPHDADLHLSTTSHNQF